MSNLTGEDPEVRVFQDSWNPFQWLFHPGVAPVEGRFAAEKPRPIFQSYILIILYASVSVYVRLQEDLGESPPFQGLKDQTFFSDILGSFFRLGGKHYLLPLSLPEGPSMPVLFFQMEQSQSYVVHKVI